jgi:hypothetical protein
VAKRTKVVCYKKQHITLQNNKRRERFYLGRDRKVSVFYVCPPRLRDGHKGRMIIDGKKCPRFTGEPFSGKEVNKIMNYKTRITTAIATGAVLLNAIAPVAFADTITVTGNGVYSDNTVNAASQTTTVVSQSNNATVNNNVNSNASTGGNSANYNTGGNTTVNTGNATTNVGVNNNLNTNSANANCGTCAGGPTNVTVSGNGVGSDNAVNVLSASNTTVNQNNNANVRNDIDANASTGKNDAKYNTGGDVTIMTGNASTSVAVNTVANRNLAHVGGGSGSNNGSSVQILGNGAWSDNTVNLLDSSSVVLTQDNNANIDNDVDADAKTGGNEAKFNTGGDVTIDTGDAEATAWVNNSVNFNAADVDCGCLLGGTDVKIAENGVHSDNAVNATSADGLWVLADNQANLDNDVDPEAKTGYNDANLNTGHHDGDPSVTTGNAESSTFINNEGNVNVFGEGEGLELPGDWNLDFDFDFAGLMGWFGFHLG